MAILIISWIVVSFVLALLAHTVVPDDGVIDVDVTLVLGMTCALVGCALGNHALGAPLWGVHVAGFAGGALGAIVGVAAGAWGQRRRAT